MHVQLSCHSLPLTSVRQPGEQGLVNGLANTLQAAFRGFRRAQTGNVQNYALVMGGGLFCLVAAYLLFR